MDKVSIIVPARNEKWLSKTIDDLFAKAKEEIEVIVVLDGPTEFDLPKERPNLIFIKKSVSEGLRRAIKDASYVATGKYLMKIDAHCMVSEGFDRVLKADCEGNWVVVSRYYALEPETWTIGDKKYYSDYFYLGFPWENHRSFSFQDVPWKSRDKAKKNILIDETMTIQASLWFMTAEHFHKRLGGLDEKRWGSWSCEQQEISLKTWLSGGKVMVNKNVWNAHYQRDIDERRILNPEYSRKTDLYIHRDFAVYFLNNKWEGQVHKFDWLIEHFWPLPNAMTRADGEKYPWPDNWKEYFNK